MSYTQLILWPEYAEIPVLASDGHPLRIGTVVTCWDKDGPWGKEQGVVVCPHSSFYDPENKQYTVGVFYFPEVPQNIFPDSHEVTEWDSRHLFLKRSISSSIDFLLEGEHWMQCPRMQWFEPGELVVCNDFGMQNLMRRVYGNHCHTLCMFPEYFPQDPRAHMCHIAECCRRASALTFFNSWGKVVPFFACARHHLQYHRWYGDVVPTLRRQPLTPKGVPIVDAYSQTAA